MRLYLNSIVFLGLASLSMGQQTDSGSIDAGKAVYNTVCIACHQPTGLGLPPVFPTLSNTEYVSGSVERFAAIILKGILGPITVNGTVFNNVMPPQEAMLSDDKIAAVISYVRSSFGNSYPPVTVDVVKAARERFSERKTPWSEADLKNW